MIFIRYLQSHGQSTKAYLPVFIEYFWIFEAGH